MLKCPNAVVLCLIDGAVLCASSKSNGMHSSRKGHVDCKAACRCMTQGQHWRVHDLSQAIWETSARSDIPRWFSANEGQQVFQIAVITGCLSFLASPGLCSHLLCLLVGKLLHETKPDWSAMISPDRRYMLKNSFWTGDMGSHSMHDAGSSSTQHSDGYKTPTWIICRLLLCVN